MLPILSQICKNIAGQDESRPRFSSHGTRELCLGVQQMFEVRNNKSPYHDNESGSLPGRIWADAVRDDLNSLLMDTGHFRLVDANQPVK